jgi:EAL domain-containing protein (putative c-di-GMP-specific phosphodiesterase class I)
VDSRDNSESQVCYVNQSILTQMQKQEDVKKVIMDALDDDRVEVFYQPIYSISEQAFVSAEALVRIRSVDGSIIPPGVFIPVAEESGIIGNLGERVFEKTCQFLCESGITSLGIHYIEVNLSVVQCEQRDLADRYIRIMKKHKVDPWLINLEITETGSVHTKKILLENMRKLIDYGVSFSLDDFGNGQSNLDYVIDMPVSIMKLDMTMTQNYFKSLKAQFVMRAAVGMAHDIDLFIVAEGVETKEQLEEMAKLKIDYIQGYYFSKPLPQDEFFAFIKAHAGNREIASVY